MPQPIHVPRVLQQVLVDVFAENDLLLHRDRRIESIRVGNAAYAERTGGG
jgi:hypothetical protein